MKPLSGWKRLWLVACTICWIGGGVWIAPHIMSAWPQQPDPFGVCVERHAPDFPIYRIPDWKQREVDACMADLRTGEAVARADADHREALTGFWIGVVVALVALTMAPIVGGLVLWGAYKVARWVRDGFAFSPEP